MKNRIHTLNKNNINHSAAQRTVTFVLCAVMLLQMFPFAAFSAERGSYKAEKPAESIDGDTADIADTDDGSVIIADDGTRLVVTSPSDSPLLDPSNFQDATLAAINRNTAGNAAITPNADETENDPAESPDYDRSTPPLQEDVTVDSVTIGNVYIRWLSKSDGEETPAYFGTLELDPASDAVGNQQFQIDISLSGQEAYEPGDIEIVIPAYLWLDRYKKEPGFLTLAVPEAPAEGAEFVWTRVDDSIVITNQKTMSAASKIMLQGTFREVVAHEMFDNTHSDDYFVIINVRTPQGNTASKESNHIDATLDTEIRVTGANKTAYNTYSGTYNVWWESTPSGMPSELLSNLKGKDPGDYVFVRWYVSGTANGNQPFDMFTEDSIPDDDPYGGIMLGVSHSAEGTVVSEDGKTVRAKLYSGYSTSEKTAYVWTAYKKELFPQDKSVKIPNSQTVYVTGWDDKITSEHPASASVQTKIPTTYTFIKHWDDNNDAAGNRPDDLLLRIFYNSTVWREYTLTAADAADTSGPTNDWTYTWSDQGLPGSFKVEEELHNAAGYLDEGFDQTDHYRDMWNYFLDRTEYDPLTHTWTYINSYSEGWIHFPISSIEKDVEWTYQDSAVVSTRDKQSLNRLLLGETIMVKYPITSTISAAESSFWFKASPNLFVLADEEYYLNSNTTLTTDDIDIGAITLSTPQAWGYVDDTLDRETGWYQRDKIDSGTATLYGFTGKYDSSGEPIWIELASIQNDRVTPLRSGVTVPDPINDPLTLSLPKGIAQVKLELLSNAQFVEMGYTVSLRVRPTDKVKDIISAGFDEGDYLRLPLSNRAHAYAVYAGDEIIRDSLGEPIYSPGDKVADMNDNATGYLHGRQFRVAANLTKSFAVPENGNDPINRRIRLFSSITYTQQSNALMDQRSEYDEAIKNGELPNSASGIFYDLLPQGVSVDLDSIKPTFAGDTVARSYIILNYRESGRTLLVVEVNFKNNISYSSFSPYGGTYPSHGWKNSHTITFDSYVTWDFIKSSPNGLDMHNVCAFESAENQIGTLKGWRGEPDDPEGGEHTRSGAAFDTNTERSLMNDLDDYRDDPSFVYAGADLDITELDYAAFSQLQKTVQAAGSSAWSKGKENDVNVQEGGMYTYRLYMTSAANTETRNMILIDSIENYIPIQGVDIDAGDNQWHGSLISIDLSEVIEKGAYPVVYYSYEENLDISDYFAGGKADEVIENLKTRKNSEGNLIWASVTADQLSGVDLTAVRAIAIDMRYCDADETEDFILKAEDSMSVYLNMRAPFENTENPDYFKNREGEDTDGSDHTQNAHAYNNVYLSCIQKVNGEDQNAYIHEAYTKVGIYTKNVKLTKLWDDDDDRDGLRPNSVTVRLLANGADAGKEPLILSDENGWYGEFDRLPTYDESGCYIDYSYEETFDSKESYTQIVSRNVGADGVLYVTLTNRHEPEKMKISVKKLWVGDETSPAARPAFITVNLYANGKYTGKSLTITPDADGNWSGAFTELEKYYNRGTDIEYTLREDGVDNYIQRGEIELFLNEETGEWYFQVENELYPYGNLSVTKQVSNFTAAALENEFTFTLLLNLPVEGEESSPATDKYYYRIFNADNSVILGDNPLTDPESEEKYTGEIGNGDEFKLKDSQKIVIYDIPTHINYTILEESSRGFELTGTVNNTGEILSYSTAEAAFINTYTTKGSAQIEAQKNLTGAALKSYQFRFDLYDEGGIEEGTLIRSVNNTSTGKTRFGQIGYSAADDGKTFIYYLYEYNAERPGYKYDTKCYRVEITPHDTGKGTMETQIKYFELDTRNENYKELEGRELPGNEIPVFNNEYHAKGELTFRAWKILDVRELKKGDFTFELYNSEFTLLETTENDGSGLITFSPIEFNETQLGESYWFYVREQKGKDSAVIYDKSVLGYLVTPSDNEDGTLSFSQSVYDLTNAFSTCIKCGGTGVAENQDESASPDSENAKKCPDCSGFGLILDKTLLSTQGDGIVPLFHNGLVNGSLALSKYTAGEDYNPNTEFRFRIKLIGDKIDEIEQLEYEIIGAEEKTFPDVGKLQPSDTSNNDPLPDEADAPSSPAPDRGKTSDAAAGEETSSPAAANAAAKIPAGFSATAKSDPVMPMAVTASGTCGGVSWEIENGVLRLRPTNGVEGTLDNFTQKSDVPWYGKTFSSVAIYPGVKTNKTSPYMFYWGKFYTITGLENLDVSQTTALNSMFDECNSVVEVCMAYFDVSNITTMQYFFYAARAMTKLDIRGWDAAKLSNSGSMFVSVSKLFEVKITEKSLNRITLPSPPAPYFWIAKEDINNPDADTFTSAQLKGKSGTFVWNVPCYKVNFEPGEYGKGAMDWAAAPAEMEYIVHQNKFTSSDPNFEFAGWMNKKTGEKYSPTNGYYAMPANTFSQGDEITLVALWERIGYDVRFEPGADGVTGEMEDLSSKLADSLTITNKYEYPNHRLIGWRDDVNDLEFPVSNGVATIPANTYTKDLTDNPVTLIAQWLNLNYTVTFTGGTANGSMINASGTAHDNYTLPYNRFTRYGYVFAGWRDEKKGIDFTPDPSTGLITIPAETYEESENVTLTAIWKKIDTTVSLSDGEFEITLRGGETALFMDNIPAGTAYQIWEETPNGWILVEQKNSAGVIEPAQTSEADFFNLWQPYITAANIAGTKMLDSRASAGYGTTPFSFELWESFDDGREDELRQTVTAQDGGFILFDTIIYKEAGVHTYYVREVDTGSPDIQYDDHIEYITVDVKEQEGGGLISDLTYGSGSIMQFENHLIPGSLEITKLASGMTADTKNPNFTFKISFYNEKGAPVEGDPYYWYVINKNGEVVGSGKIDDNGNQGGENEDAPASPNSTAAVAYTADISQSSSVMPLASSAASDHGTVRYKGAIGTVTWEIYSDGTLLFRPTNGVSGETLSLDGRVSRTWASATYYAIVTAIEIKPGVKLIGKAGSFFEGFKNVTEFIGIENLDVSGCTYMYTMFRSCSSLKALDLSSWDVSKVTSMNGMFLDCSSLTVLDVSTWDVSKVTDLNNILNKTSIFRLDLSRWDTTANIGTTGVFSGLTALFEVKIGEKTYACSRIPAFSYQGTWVAKDDINNPDAQTYTSAELKTAPPNTYVWNVDCYKVNYEKGAADATGSMEWAPAPTETDFVINKNLFTRPGYRFAGWANKDTGEIYTEENGIAIIPANSFGKGESVTLEAIWERITYTVSFDGGEANGSMMNASGIADEDFILPANTFLLPGYEFAGWRDASTNQEFTPDKTTGLITIPADTYEENAIVSLSAIWKKLDGENTAAYYIYHYQQKATLTDEYELAGMTVVYSHPGDTVDYPVMDYTGFTSPTPESGTDYTHSYFYDRLVFTVHFNGNGEDSGEMAPLTVIGGVSYILGNSFEKKDCIFLGWNTKADGSGIMYNHRTRVIIAPTGEEMTLYAQWLKADGSFDVTKGEIIVSCKAGQTIVFPNLPAGTTYTIEEIDVPYGWSFKSGENTSGTVAPAGKHNASITNLYTPSGKASITAHKLFEGGTLEDGMFTFELYNSDFEFLDSAVNGAPSIIEGEIGGNTPEGETTNWYGWGSILFDNLSYDKTGTYTYYIKEINGGNNSIDYSDKLQKITVVVSDNGDGTLASQVIYENGENGAPFVNYVSKGSITVSKTVTNSRPAAANTEFGFNIELQDENDDPVNGDFILELPGKTPEKITAAEGIVGPVYIKGNESFTLSGVPDGTHYTVTEIPAPGFTQVKLTNSTGIIIGHKTADVQCVNDYTVSTVVYLEAEKLFYGGELTDGMFTFELTDIYGNVLQSADASAEGKIAFEPIVYTIDDLGYHNYLIREVKRSANGIVYDTHSSFIQILVYEDGSGGITWKYEESGENDRTFVNATAFDLTVSKTVSGEVNISPEFNFVLTLTNEYGLDLSQITWTNGEKNGSIKDLLPASAEEAQDNSENTEETAQYSFSLIAGETITFHNLPHGTTYVIEEVLGSLAPYFTTTVTSSDPDGYASDEERTAKGKITDTDISVSYNNHSDAQIVDLPGSGGNTAWIKRTAAAVLLLTLSAALLLRKQRAKKKK